MQLIHSNPPDMIGRLPIFRSFSRPNKKSPDETTSVKLLEKGETEANSLTTIDNKCQEGIFHGLEDLMFKIPPLDTTMVVSQGQIHCTSHSILMQTPDIRNLRVGMYASTTYKYLLSLFGEISRSRVISPDESELSEKISRYQMFRGWNV